ncbi:hypothetical protein G6F57_005649 [Rhizopus arrhizus]|uniref:Tc1-like transposase DDE domain-containing protein n=1 Tax=Rhizopus oryzae TaxID=64495 RepID=A0A9P7BSS5_RHIOR|nr:hypothetical protein G6F30_007095 [Rhizopus arrhizus]KAG0981279.1 hypothetical protein G6F29_007184 [Rhizopus arrhizus]KAG0993344.1 hypothetical protein G6F28_006778 [Rhizopus arrhizus]KAG1007234.1 hypothetical protein G6F27_007571 [Rhizopus arrhizus]KAG1022786.1 hypothetical protein G6F26_007353 [Rhizopus arrhizus]
MFAHQGFQKPLRFQGILETDGVGVSIIKQNTDTSRKSPKPNAEKKVDGNQTEHIEGLDQADLKSAEGKCVLIDTGRRDLMYCMKETSTVEEKQTLIFTKNNRSKCSRHFRYLRRRAQPFVVQKAEAIFSRSKSNSVDLKKFVQYIKTRASIKLLNAAESARRAGVKVRTGQAWSARMKEDPNWNIYEKQTNQNKIVTRHPHARNTDNTRKERHDWVKTWSKTDMDFNSNCVFIDESAFDINMRPPTARSARGTPVIITTPTTRAISHTILGAICPMGVVNMEIRVPLKSKRIKVAGSRKRKSPAAKKPATGGTNSGHYDRFMNLTLDEMDKYPEMKGFYLVMDNSPIHDKKSGEIDKMIED